MYAKGAEMFERECRIRKQDIAACGALKGFLNDRSVTVGAATYVNARQVQYLGFAGALDVETGLYVGKHRFMFPAPGMADDAPVSDLMLIPGMLEPTQVGELTEDGDGEDT